jgi:heat shock protein HtpX
MLSLTDPMLPHAAAERTRRRRRSRLHSVALLLAMAGLLGLCGWLVAGWQGVLWSVVGGAVAFGFVARTPVELLLAGMGARALSPEEAPGLLSMFAGLCRRAGLQQPPVLCHVDEGLPLAFSIGRNDDTAVVLDDTLLLGLSRRELGGILAHEIAHLRSGDILLKQIGFVLGWLTRVMSQLGVMLLIVGLLLRAFLAVRWPLLALLVLALAPIGVQLLQLALSRGREAEADLEAAELTGDPEGLAAALQKLRQWQERRLRRVFPTGRVFHLPTLLNDHPPTDERIRRLMHLARQRSNLR